MTDWLPETLPTHVDVDGLTFVPLTPLLVEPDYAAVMRDIPMLRAWSGQDWPTATFPIESNLEDLIRHDREQTERVALTYSVLVEATVQGCVYVQPLAAALRARNLAPDLVEAGTDDVVVRGWLHDRPAAHLIRACMGWLGRAPFEFPRLWWQTNSLCPEQLDACNELGLLESRRIAVGDRIWELRS